MKAILTILCGILVGLGCAFAYFKFESTTIPEEFPVNGWPMTGKLVDPAPDLTFRGTPQVRLEKMPSGEVIRRQIFVENVGNKDGEIWLNGAPPDSLQVDMDVERRYKIPANSSYPLNIEAVAPVGSEKYSKSLVIQTSQESKPRLVLNIEGIVVPGLGIFPESRSLSPSDVAAKKPLEFFLGRWTEKSVEVKQATISPHPELFDIQVLPLTESGRKEFPSIQSGFTIQVTAKSELPDEPTSYLLSVEPQNSDFAVQTAKIEIIK